MLLGQRNQNILQFIFLFSQSPIVWQLVISLLIYAKRDLSKSYGGIFSWHWRERLFRRACEVRLSLFVA